MLDLCTIIVKREKTNVTSAIYLSRNPEAITMMKTDKFNFDKATKRSSFFFFCSRQDFARKKAVFRNQQNFPLLLCSNRPRFSVSN